jgi:Predicted sugar epimerase
MEKITFALNHMVVPTAGLDRFFGLARSLGIDAVEIRNDLADNAIADGTEPLAVRELAATHGVTLLSINALYPFNCWDAALENKAQSLISYAASAGVKGLVLVPLNDGTGQEDGSRQQRLREALANLKPLLANAGLIGLVEPLGFDFCSLRSKREALDAIDAVDGFGTFKLVHDTFHHHIAGEEELFPEHTGLIHISGVVQGDLASSDMRDPHRVLVDGSDRLDNLGQIRALRGAGCKAPLSFEPFAPEVHQLADLKAALSASVDYIRSHL